jgi:hypothetical protein
MGSRMLENGPCETRTTAPGSDISNERVHGSIRRRRRDTAPDGSPVRRGGQRGRLTTRAGYGAAHRLGQARIVLDTLDAANVRPPRPAVTGAYGKPDPDAPRERSLHGVAHPPVEDLAARKAAAG